jgi:hypothetical protein
VLGRRIRLADVAVPAKVLQEPPRTRVAGGRPAGGSRLSEILEGSAGSCKQVSRHSFLLTADHWLLQPSMPTIDGSATDAADRSSPCNQRLHARMHC